MSEFIYNNADLVSWIIGGLVAIGLSLVFLELRYKVRTRLHIQPAIRRFGPSIVFICLGGVLFLGMLLLDYQMNKTILNKWAFVVTLEFLFGIVFFTVLTYFMAGRVLRRF